ncbi:SMI1/KNR4 family protein [Actinomadura sp. NPDC048021]|uniref:SMI1/KNR4 family protein n=1 Tax=Actinomadura sp. NPDC048021 TaxID=3155385 RepID=UPI0033EA2982
MWRELIERLYDDAEFAAPATDAAIDDIERRLGQRVPDELREVLRETDGVLGDYGSGLVWPVHEIIDQNTEFRQNAALAALYKPFDQFMFVGDNGGGDQFAYVLPTGERPGGVFVWDHETDERIRVADSLKAYLESRAAADGDDWYK